MAFFINTPGDCIKFSRRAVQIVAAYEHEAADFPPLYNYTVLL